MTSSTRLRLLAGLALAVVACGHSDPPRQDPAPAATTAATLSGDALTDCDRVAAHGAGVIARHFEALSARLAAPDRDAWMADIHRRFGADGLAARCEERLEDADFDRAVACAAGATTMAKLMRCRLWTAAAS